MRASRRRIPPYRWLACAPPLALLGGVPVVNGAPGDVLGLPVLLAWIVGCILLTSLVLAVIAVLDERAARAARRDGA